MYFPLTQESKDTQSTAGVRVAFHQVLDNPGSFQLSASLHLGCGTHSQGPKQPLECWQQNGKRDEEKEAKRMHQLSLKEAHASLT